MPITIHELAESRGLEMKDGSASEEAYAAVGLQIMGGCGGCGAGLAAYNAYPSTAGTWRCGDCIEENGFDTAEQFEQFNSHQARESRA